MKLRCIAFAGGMLLALSLPLSANLSLEDESQRLLIATETAVAEGRWQEAKDYMNRLLEKEQVRLPAEFYFLRGRIMEQAGQPRQARQAYERYVNGAGREGEMYQVALRRITQLEESESRRGGDFSGSGEFSRSGQQSIASIEPAGADELKQLRALYLTDNNVQALVEHANSLLSLNAWEGPSRVVVRQSQRGVRYRLRVDDGRLQVRTRKFDNEGGVRVRMDPINVYGVNPRLDSDCYPEESACWIADPRDNSRWLKLREDPSAARETARVLGLLIREMQQNR
ncbi:MAG: hypothetical protein R3296_08050 [Oleiphilaceae bacterium]|nr:hypothetical protein [Oleiphilaceae bacterium]